MSAAPLIGNDYDHLAIMLGVCGPDHDGEVAAAARCLVRERGLTWSDVVSTASVWRGVTV